MRGALDQTAETYRTAEANAPGEVVVIP